MISKVAVVDKRLQGLCRQPDAHHYDRLGQRGRSNLLVGSQKPSCEHSNACKDTIVTCYMWSQVEPTMAIVCACFTTLRPLFAGVDFNFLSALRWTSRRTASSSSAKSKGRRTDRREGLESDQKRQENRSPERHKSDIELVQFEQVLDVGTQEAIRYAERAESSRRWNNWQEDGASTTFRARIEESFV